MDSETEYRTCDDIFTCTQCGQCCSGFGGTYVTEADIGRIAEFIKTDSDTFVTRFCQMSGSRPLLVQKQDGFCIFFDKLCTIHPVKPYMCRAWPFIRTIVKNPENWDAMAGSCPGMKPGIPHDRLKAIVEEEVLKLDSQIKQG
ncbi:MAG: YkgJ family cysteine cluster protein [Pseudomonadota bacterium]